VRTRSAKKLAQRIDLNYFKRPHPLRRWRTGLSIAAPLIGLLWLGSLAVAGSRGHYSSGPVSAAHAFAEQKCEVCHARDASFRAHVSDGACLTCHDAPKHADHPIAAMPSAPQCATCHREHRGRISLAATVPEDFCTQCHTVGSGVAPRAPGSAAGQRGQAPPLAVAGFPDDHPEFAALRGGYEDPGTIKFNHEVHAKKDLRGPSGPETLECATCHKPEIVRASSQRRTTTGLMASVSYEQQCARCHTLFFDERLDVQAPHEQLDAIMPFVERSLREYLAAHPNAWREPDGPSRRVPLNFPRPAEPPAQSAQDWIQRRTARAQQLMEQRACAECHDRGSFGNVDGMPGRYTGGLVGKANVTKPWMPAAKFDHAPHLMVQCTSCHAAEKSRLTSDVLMPSAASCATCHAPGKGASSSCAECHGYHDWSKAQPVKPTFTLGDFR
jgi:hypothetical protein